MANNIYSVGGIAPPQPTALTPIGTPSSSGGLSFGDILDTVNPLQHIPVVSGVYRSITGSTISPAAQIAGDTMYGAALGGPALAAAALAFSSSAADVAVTQATGSSIPGHVLATLGIGSSASATTAAAGSVASPAPLTPLPPNAGVPNTTAASVQQQAQAAAQVITHAGLHPERANGQYQRAQAFDALNKQLMTI